MTPRKTESRAHSSRSSGAQSSWLQPMVVRRARWRRGQTVSSVRSSVREASRTVISCALLSRSWAQASSTASGMPSRRRQISATAAALAGSSSERSGATAAARSWKSRTASSPSSPADSGGTSTHVSPAEPSGSRLVARTVSPGAAASSSVTSRPQGPTIRSQQSRTSRRLFPESHSPRAATGRRGLWSRSPTPSQTVVASNWSSWRWDRPAHQTPSAYRPRARSAVRRASRLLPTPPLPVSVTSR